jgi:hypothetical protein
MNNDSLRCAVEKFACPLTVLTRGAGEKWIRRAAEKFFTRSTGEFSRGVIPPGRKSRVNVWKRILYVSPYSGGSEE